MIIVTYILYVFGWLVTRVLREQFVSRFVVDMVAVTGLYFITKFFIDNTL